MSDKKAGPRKVAGIVRVSKKDRKNLAGKTSWALLAAEQKRDEKQS